MVLSGLLHAQNLEVSTYAGSGTPGYMDGPESLAKFRSPASVVVDGASNVYVADSGNNMIRKITPQGVVSTVAGNTNNPVIGGYSGGYVDGLGTNAQFSDPTGIALDAATNIYVADTGNNVIRKITVGGVVTTLAGNTNSGNANGVGTNAQFDHPYGMALDPDTNVYVADTYNMTIRKITPQGIVTTYAGTNGEFSWPNAVAVDALTNVYVSDTKIYKVAKNGVVTAYAGTNAEFFTTMGLAVDAATNLYVTGYDSIYKVTPAGSISLLAGGDGFHGYVDGPALNAEFQEFYNGVSVGFDASNNVFVGDFGNNVIRKISRIVYPAQDQNIASFVAILTKTQGGPSITVTSPSASSGLPVVLSAFGPVSLSDNTLSTTGPGQAVVVVEQSGDTTYSATAQATSFKITPMSKSTPVQTLKNFKPIPAKVYGAAPFTVLTPTASSGGQVDLSIFGPAALSGNRVTITGVGQVVLVATQTGSGSYGPTAEFTTFKVAQAKQTIGKFAPIAPQTHGNTYNVSLPTSTSGLPTTLGVKSGPATVSGNTVTFTSAGKVVLQATQEGNAYIAAAKPVTITIKVN